MTKNDLFAVLDEYFESRGILVDDPGVDDDANLIVLPFGTIVKDPVADARASVGDPMSADFQPGRMWVDPSWNKSYHKFLQVKANADAVANGHRAMAVFDVLEPEDQLDIAEFVWYNRSVYGLSDEQAIDLISA